MDFLYPKTLHLAKTNYQETNYQSGKFYQGKTKLSRRAGQRSCGPNKDRIIQDVSGDI